MRAYVVSDFVFIDYIADIVAITAGLGAVYIHGTAAAAVLLMSVYISIHPVMET